MDLLDLLHRFEILSPAHAEALRGESSLFQCESRTVARSLVERGWLTPFQANQLLLGRGEELDFGAYVLLERIGAGGMGQVVKARHRTLNRVVAIKMLRKERAANPDSVRRFQREIRAASALMHPNFVLLFDADVHNGVPFFVMEFVAGSDLSRLVKASGPLDVATACDYARQAAEGLAFAHARGFVHRDIKPSNLFRCEESGVIKILDLGMARVEEAAEEMALTQEGKILGTPDYIAPEQAVNSRGADARADLYSLGCTLFHLLTAQVPFPQGGSVMERLMQHQTMDPTPIEQLRPELPEAVRDVVRRLIRRRPEERMQTAEELVEVLRPLTVRPSPTTATQAPRGTLVERWYYRHGSETVGPLSAREIKEHARAGRLAADDSLWPEGVSGSHSVRAELVVGGAAFATAGPTPGWLKDIATLERARAKPLPPPPSSEAPRPRWLDDMAAPPSSDPPAPPPSPPQLPDWIDDIRRSEGG